MVYTFKFLNLGYFFNRINSQRSTRHQVLKILKTKFVAKTELHCIRFVYNNINLGQEVRNMCSF